MQKASGRHRLYQSVSDRSGFLDKIASNPGKRHAVNRNKIRTYDNTAFRKIAPRRLHSNPPAKQGRGFSVLREGETNMVLHGYLFGWVSGSLRGSAVNGGSGSAASSSLARSGCF